MTALTRLWRRFVTLVTLTRYVEYMTTLPQDLAQPGNPRAWRAASPPQEVRHD